MLPNCKNSEFNKNSALGCLCKSASEEMGFTKEKCIAKIKELCKAMWVALHPFILSAPAVLSFLLIEGDSHIPTYIDFATMLAISMATCLLWNMLNIPANFINCENDGFKTWRALFFEAIATITLSTFMSSYYVIISRLIKDTTPKDSDPIWAMIIMLIWGIFSPLFSREAITTRNWNWNPKPIIFISEMIAGASIIGAIISWSEKLKISPDKLLTSKDALFYIAIAGYLSYFFKMISIERKDKNTESESIKAEQQPK